MLKIRNLRILSRYTVCGVLKCHRTNVTTRENVRGIKPYDVSPEYSIEDRSYKSFSILDLVPKTSKSINIESIKSHLVNDQSLEFSQWEKVINNFSLENAAIKQQAIPVALMKLCCEFSSGTTGYSLLNYMKRNGELTSIALSSWFMILSAIKPNHNSSLLLSVVDDIKQRYPVLDSKTAVFIIIALSKTSRWQEGLQLLKHVGTSDLKFQSLANSFIADAAFRAGHFDKGFDILENLFESNNLPYESAFGYMFSCDLHSMNENFADFEDNIKKVLTFWRKYYFYPSKGLIEKMKNYFERLPKSSWLGGLTYIGFSGVCPVCGQKLEKESLVKEEYTELRTKFFERVLFGKNIFLKTTPKELHYFEKFLTEHSPFDVVIDGLNVYYALNKHKTHQEKAQQLLTIVKHFASQKKKVLLIGKHHLRSMHPNILKEIRRNALMFTTDNISKDDPFILYAALYSGYRTKILSRDMLRDHIYKLNDKGLQNIFMRWQQLHQIEVISITRDGVVNLQEPATHVFGAQWDSRSYHIPYNDGTLYGPYQAPGNWLCLQKS